MTNTLSTLCLVALVMGAAAQPAEASLNAYLRLSGETQGEIKGSVTQAGREDSIMVIAVDMPYPGKGMFRNTITVTKEVDRSSPLLYEALEQRETITEWRLEFWRR